MKCFYTWFVALTVLAVALPDAAAQFSNTVINRRQTVNSTLQSFSNNVNNKATDYTNKFNSLRNGMSNQLTSAQQTLTRFLTDTTIGASALLVSDVLNAAETALVEGVNQGIYTIGSGYAAVSGCLGAKTQASVDAGIDSLTTANTNVTVTISTTASSFASRCRSRYSNNANDFVNQMADRLQDCLNAENTQLSRVSSILNNFMTLMRRNYEGLSNTVRYCSGLGSVSSRSDVKAEINGCLDSLAAIAYPIYKSNIEQQFVLVSTMLQLEVVASNNRVKSCQNQVTYTYQAMADAIPIALSSCLITGE